VAEDANPSPWNLGAHRPACSKPSRLAYVWPVRCGAAEVLVRVELNVTLELKVLLDWTRREAIRFAWIRKLGWNIDVPLM
jgi:hypothetical protein